MAIDHNDQEGAKPSNAIDGKVNTYWASTEQTGEAQPWFELDFHAEKTFKKIKYTPRFDNTAKYDCTGRILKMQVQIPEGDSWKTVQEFSLNSGKEQGEQTLDLDAPQTATKVRLVVLESFHHESAKKNKAANIAEVDVLTADNKSVVDRASADASGWTPKVDSSSTEGGDAGGAAALTDGNPGTYWHSNYGQGSGNKKAPYKVTIDRGASKGEFQTVAYLPRPQANANGSWQEFEVYASDTEAGLFEPESKLQNAEGSSVFRAGYDKVWENGQAKWMYFGLKERLC